MVLLVSMLSFCFFNELVFLQSVSKSFKKFYCKKHCVLSAAYFICVFSNILQNKVNVKVNFETKKVKVRKKNNTKESHISVRHSGFRV